MHSEWDKQILIGTGGSSPALFALEPRGGDADTLVTLPVGDSVYAFDRSGAWIVLGTKGGKVRCLQRSGDETVCDEILTRPDTRPAPAVLSVCMAGEDEILVSDSVGGCFGYCAESSFTPTPLPTEGRIVCSLTVVPRQRVAGLTTGGLLIVWDRPSRQIVAHVAGPPPPRYAALVRMMYVAATDSLFYPSSDGELVRYHIEGGALSLAPAHGGEWYAIAPVAGGVISAGMHDGCLRFWEGDLSEASCQMPCPQGIQSIAPMDERGTSLVLLSRDGEAGVYKRKAGSLERIAQLPLKDCRVAVGPVPDQLKMHRLNAERERAKDVAREIAGQTPCDGSDVESMHLELESLGYKHVSLALLAQRAGSNGELHEELHHRAQLADSLPDADAGCRRSLERYAILLERAWQLEEAAAVYERLLSLQPDHPYSTRLDRVTKYLREMQSTVCIIKADIPPSELIGAADALDKAFVGKWLLKYFSPMRCTNTMATPEAVAERWEQVDSSVSKATSADATVEDVSLLSDRSIEKVRIVRIPHGVDDELRLELCCNVVHDGNQSVVVPFLVLCSDGMVASWNVHNSRVQEYVACFGRNPAVASWVKGALQRLHHVLRGLVTEAAAGSGRGGCNEH